MRIIHIKSDDIVVDIFVWIGDLLLRNDCLTTDTEDLLFAVYF